MTPPADPTDDAQMLALQAGDLSALDHLFARHHGRLYGFLARLTGDPHAAEDLVQEVFLRVLRFHDRYEGNGTFLAWLYRIARNLAADAYAKRRDLRPLDEADALPSAATPPLDHLEREEQRAQLERALAALPTAHREVLLLRGVDGLAHRDVAIALGCTEGAARVRVHRAIAALKRQWQALPGGMT